MVTWRSAADRAIVGYGCPKTKKALTKNMRPVVVVVWPNLTWHTLTTHVKSLSSDSSRMIPFCLLLLILPSLTHSFFSESLIRKDQLRNVLDHEPAKQQTACQNAVVRASPISFIRQIKVSTYSSQDQSRPHYATMKQWRVSTMIFLIIYPS